MKFRKKPVIIEAMQFSGASSISIKGVCGYGGCCPDGIKKLHVHTIHNNQAVFIEHGDWIIPEPDGTHFYPIKPDIFEATYEKVEE